MSATIKKFLPHQHDQKVLSEIKEIFFESSTKKEFKDENEKEQFFWKYLGFYLKHLPEYIWFAWEKKVLGYIVASPGTGEEFINIQPHLRIFEKEFQKYPAHLHINCHVDTRGLGIGAKLIEAAEITLKNQNIAGLHIMTGPASRNRGFYQKLGFTYEVESNFHGSPLLFMGKALT